MASNKDYDIEEVSNDYKQKVKAMLENRDREIHNLKGEIEENKRFSTSFRTEQASLRKDLELERKKAIDLEKDLKEVLREVDEFEEDLRNRDIEIETLKETIKEAEARVESAKAQAEIDLQEAEKVFQSDLKTFETKFENEALEEKKWMAKELVKREQAYEAELAKLKATSATNLGTLTESLEEKEMNARKNEISLKKELDHSKKEANDLRKRIADQSDEIDALTTALEMSINDNKVLLDRNTQVENYLEKLEAQAAMMKPPSVPKIVPRPGTVPKGTPTKNDIQAVKEGNKYLDRLTSAGKPLLFEAPTNPGKIELNDDSSDDDVGSEGSSDQSGSDDDEVSEEI